MRVLGQLLQGARRWLAENSETGGGERRAWDAVHFILDSARPDELSEAVKELVDAAEWGDRDAKNVLAAFRRFHPPGALGNPERQKQLIGSYLMFSEGALLDTSTHIESAQFREAVRRIFE
jgi:hypothetical protein